MNITIYHLIEGSKLAKGLTVIIDVFRAFSLECYLTEMGAKEIRPVGKIEEALAWREKRPGCVLIGERGGAKLEGFDFGNSLSTVDPAAIAGKTVIHTTSAGTQGIVNAVHADEILTGSLVNAKAIADYIRRKNPAEVSLVCMGNGGIVPAKEDELCAKYIESLLINQPIPDLEEQIRNLQYEGGEHFFDPDRQHIFPQADFWCCIQKDRFDFVLRVEQDELGFVSRKVSSQEK